MNQPSIHPPLNISILASHGGSNMQAIIDQIAAGRIHARIGVMITNNSKAFAVERARRAGIAVRHLSGAQFATEDELDGAILAALRQAGTDLVVLAGYMKKLGPRTLAGYRGRIINIHPALLPRHGGPGMFGIHPHEAALAAGDAESGATVHLVTEEYDRGPILRQERVAIEPGDTPESLQRRVLAVEHRIYPEVIREIAERQIELPIPE